MIGEPEINLIRCMRSLEKEALAILADPDRPEWIRRVAQGTLNLAAIPIPASACSHCQRGACKRPHEGLCFCSCGKCRLRCGCEVCRLTEDL